jgi:hypothetical protein
MLFRRITCSLLLVVFLFNLFGYRLVLHYWKQTENQHSQVKNSNRKYEPGDLVEIKIPLRIAYIKNSEAFEYINGDIEYNGKYYQYVSGEISGDTLIIRCIPNLAKTKFQSAKDAFLSMVDGLDKQASSKKNSESNSRPLFKAMGDCILDGPGYALSQLLHTSFSYGRQPDQAPETMSISVPWQPPDQMV